MNQEKLTIGQAIDRIIAALEPLEPDARKTALTATCAYLGIPLDQTPTESEKAEKKTPVTEPQTDTTPARTTTGPKTTAPKKDIRTLKAEKKPSSARHMACIVAYYLQEMAPEDEKKDSISTEDLEKYFKQAGFKLPQKMGQILIDAKASGYFDSAGRGEYKLNAVGYNLVAHTLPKADRAE